MFKGEVGSRRAIVFPSGVPFYYINTDVVEESLPIDIASLKESNDLKSIC